jgi:hypothetical protein
MRPPGMDDEISIASGGNGSYQHWNKEESLGFVGTSPQFEEPIEAVRARIEKAVDHVAVPHKIRTWHPTTNRLLKEDEKRREKQLTDPYSMSWDKPLFDTPFERRRLRVLNSLFVAVAKMNGKAFVLGRDAREIRIAFFRQHLHLTLDRPKRSNRQAKVQNTTGESSEMRLCLSILGDFGSETVLAFWQDTDAQRLEMHMTEVVVQAILTAEIRYRDNASRQYQWRVQRKAELEEERRKRRLEAEHAEKERQKRIEQARINRLLHDAAAFQQAGEIRKYVEVLRLAKASDRSCSMDDFEQWSKWALEQADRIDPAIGGRFLKSMQDEDASW